MKNDNNTAHYDLARAFDSFKSENDARLSQIERKGSADAVTEMKVNRLNEEITRLSEESKSVKTAMARSPLGLEDGVEFKEADMFATERKHAFKSGSDINTYRNYKSALNNYIRKNNAGSSIEEVKSLSVGSDPDGGYAVTPDMSGRISALVYETSPLRQVVNVAVIGTDALEGFNDLTDATSGWVGETETRTETDSPKIGQWRIPVHEQYAEPRATQKLLDDAMFDVEGYLAGKIAGKLARMENTAFIKGDGIGKPRGILTYEDGVSSADKFDVIEQINAGADGAFAASDPGDALINLVYSLKSPYRDNAVFMMNRDTLAEVRKLKDTNGNYLWQPDFQQKQGGTLLGFNIVEAEDMPTIGSDSLSIAFGDFNAGYQVVDRQGINILRDSFTAKPYVKFYTTKRVGGDVVNFEAIKLMKFAA